jgi:predicted nucleic acid-binding Zn ribbon protein
VKRPRRRAGQPRQGEALVDGLFRRLGLENEARKWRALQAFHEAAGERIGAKARGLRVHGTMLQVAVQSAAWAHELSFLRAELLERLRATPGGEWITELRFEHRPLDEAPDWDEPGPPAAPAAPPVAPSGAASAVEDGEVAAALREVTDPELRAALAELFARARAAERQA